MSTEYSRSLLRVVIAQICQSLGWTAVQATPLELLTDVLERYILEIGKKTHRYSEQFGRTEPNIDDLGLAFQDINISLAELTDFVKHAEKATFPRDISQYPVRKENNLHFPTPNSRELLEREEHIDEHLPPINQEWDEEIVPTTPSNTSSTSAFFNHSDESPMLMSPTLPGNAEKRPFEGTPTGEQPVSKRPRILPEEAGHSKYEMKSMRLAETGDLTPTRTGILPDARTPPPPTPTDPRRVPRLPPSGDMGSPALTPLKPVGSVTSETIEERTMFTEEPYSDIVAKRNENVENVAPFTPVPVVSSTPKSPKGAPKSPRAGKVKTSNKSKSPRPHSPKSPRSPRSGRSPARGKSPKGTKLKFSGSEGAFKSKLDKPITPPPVSVGSPEMKFKFKKDKEQVSFTSSDEPVSRAENDTPDELVIAEEDATLIKNNRLASYNDTIDDVIKYVAEPSISNNNHNNNENRPRLLSDSQNSISDYAKSGSPAHSDFSDSDVETEKTKTALQIGNTVDRMLERMSDDFDDEPPPKKPKDIYHFDDEPPQPLPPSQWLPPHMSSPLPPPPSQAAKSPEKKRKDKSKKDKKLKNKSQSSKKSSSDKKSPVKEKIKKKIKSSKNPGMPSLSAEWALPSKESRSPQFSQFSPLRQSFDNTERTFQPIPMDEPEEFTPKKKDGFHEKSKEGGGKKKEKKKKKNKDKEKDRDKEKSKEKSKDKNKDKSKDKNKEKSKDKKEKKEKKEKKPKEEAPATPVGIPKLTLKFGGQGNKATTVSVSSAPVDSPKSSKPEKERKVEPFKLEIPKLVIKPQFPSSDSIPPMPPSSKELAAMTSPKASKASKSKSATKLPPKPKRPPTPVYVSPPSSPSPPNSPGPVRLSPSHSPSPSPSPPKKYELPSSFPPMPPSSSSKVSPGKASATLPPLPPSSIKGKGKKGSRTVITETVGKYVDEITGETVWICPSCKFQDDGSPMIGCDRCDDWYHWVCVGITAEPDEDESWFCTKCNMAKSKGGKKPGRGRGRKKKGTP